MCFSSILMQVLPLPCRRCNRLKRPFSQSFYLWNVILVGDSPRDGAYKTDQSEHDGVCPIKTRIHTYTLRKCPRGFDWNPLLAGISRDCDWYRSMSFFLLFTRRICFWLWNRTAVNKPNGGAETNLVSRCDQELIKLLGARFEPIWTFRIENYLSQSNTAIFYVDFYFFITFYFMNSKVFFIFIKSKSGNQHL